MSDSEHDLNSVEEQEARRGDDLNAAENGGCDDSNEDHTTPGIPSKANTNKRPREEDEAGDANAGPGKKQASNVMVNTSADGTDPTDTDPPAVGTMPRNTVGADTNTEKFTEIFEMPANLIGKVIGKGGETIRNLQSTTGTTIQIDQTSEGPNKRITIKAPTAEQLERAKASVLALEAEDISEIVECPPQHVGRVIGRGGETIRALQSASEAHVAVNQDFPPDVPRQIIIQGNPQAVKRAVLMVNELIYGEPGTAQAAIQRVCAAHGIGKSEVVTAPKSIIGKIIGRGGETIKSIQKTSGATVQIDQSGDPCKLTIGGQPAAVEQCKYFIQTIMSGGDPFQPQGGGYGGGGSGGGYGGGMGGDYGGGGYGGGYPQAAAYGGYGGPAGGAAAAGYGAYPGMYAGYGGGGYPGGAGVGGGAEMYGGQAVARQAAGGGWQEYQDEQGRAYYYNATTGKTQWEKPADFA